MNADDGTSVPTSDEINPYDELDGRSACERFLGKTVQTIFAELCRGEVVYEDFMWMGPVAFKYYFRALAQYVQTESADDDDFVVTSVATAIWFQLRSHNRETKDFAPEAAALCRYVVAHIERFNLDAEERRSVCDRFDEILVSLERLTGEAG